MILGWLTNQPLSMSCDGGTIPGSLRTLAAKGWQTGDVVRKRPEVAANSAEQPDPIEELLSEECLEMIEKIQGYRERIQLPSTPKAILEDAIIEYYTALKRVGNW